MARTSLDPNGRAAGSLGLLLLVLLSGCWAQRNRSEGVHLLLNTATLEPTTTFELRFETPMVTADQVGQIGGASPLRIAPPLPGQWTWLSQRSGVFTPSEPPAMATTYRFTLRSDLRGAGGERVRAALDRTLRTPALEVQSHTHSFFYGTNAPLLPIIRLEFNAAVRVEDARRFLEFRSRNAGMVRAQVATVQREPYMDYPLGLGGWNLKPPLTWHQRFNARDVDPQAPTAPAAGVPPVPGAAMALPNVIEVKPERPLPVGADWKLRVRAGLPSPETTARLEAEYVVAIGDVQPFRVEEVKVSNRADSGKALTVRFSKPLAPSLAQGELEDWLSVVPAPAQLTFLPSWDRVEVLGEFQLSNRYVLEVKAGLPAEQPVTLPRPYTQEVEFAPLPARLYWPAFTIDQLSGGRRVFPLFSVNAGAVLVRAKQLDRHTLVHALRGYDSYFRDYEPWSDWSSFRELDFNLVPGTTIFERAYHRTNAVDAVDTLELQWNDILGGRPHGAVFLSAEHTREASPTTTARRVGTQALVQLTDLGLAWKRSRAGTLAYLFSHTTGEPVTPGTVRIASDENVTLAQGAAGEAGWLRLPAVPTGQWLVAEAGEDLHAVRYLAHELPLYRFRLPIDWEPDRTNPVRVLLFSDRPVYRPGDTAQLKAIVRTWENGGLTVPAGLGVTWRGFDATDQRFFETNLTLTAVGSSAHTVTLPTLPQGEYRVQLQVHDQTSDHSFYVKEYRPNAFELRLSAPPAYGPAEPIQPTVRAQYLFGQELTKATVFWSVSAQDAGFAPEGFDEFLFGSSIWDPQLGRAPGSMTLQGEGQYAGGTPFRFDAEVPSNPTAPQPRELDFLVEVTDLNQQTVSAASRSVRHSSDFYLGLRHERDTLGAGARLPVELVAVGREGQPWPTAVSVLVTLFKLDWETVRIEAAGGVAGYRSDPVLTQLEQIEATTLNIVREGQRWTLQPGQPPSAIVELAEIGQYLIEARARDPAGREVVTAKTLYVYGEESLAWDYRNSTRIELVADQPAYQPGDTATLLVKTPISGTALVTLERERVLRSWVTNLTGNAPAVRVRLEPEDVPNVFVSVLLIRGATNSSRALPTPEYRLGYGQLQVHPPEGRLDVNLTLERAEYRPGTRVEVLGEVRNHRQRPIAGAEVTLYAVDEGVLSLTGYATPDPYECFFASWPLGVSSHLSLPNLLPEDPSALRLQNKGFLVGGGGVARVRANFLSLAYWNAGLVTDEEGRIRASFLAPDNLTRYRVMAVVHTAGQQFGHAAATFAVNKPLMLEPALPPFAYLGDRLTARAVLHNRTDRPCSVVVRLELDDKAQLDDAAHPAPAPPALERRFTLAAHGSAPVDFPVHLTATGAAQWAWRARRAQSVVPDSTLAEPGEGQTPEPTQEPPDDSVISSLAVSYPVPKLREVHLARVTGTQSNLLASANPQLLEGKLTARVRLTNTRLGELAEAADRLLTYPYGCVEQTSSALLPWLVLRDAPAPLLRLRPDPAQQAAAIRQGISRLFAMQTIWGGLSYWPGGREPMLWASAYAGVVLAVAQRRGVELPASRWQSLLGYLKDHLRGTADLQQPRELGTRCLAAYALASAGQAETAYHELLYRRRAELSPQERAWLALALAESGAARDWTRDLLETGAATVPAGDDFGSPQTEQATRLLGWVRHDPAAPAVDTLVAELLRDRRAGHWSTTQGNAWALLALTEYAQRVEGQSQAAHGHLTWGTQRIPFALESHADAFDHVFAWAGDRAPPLLVTAATAQPVYVQAVLEAEPRPGLHPRQDRGYAVKRTYARLDDENAPQSAPTFRVGDRVLVTLAVEVRQPARYLAVEDPLPCLFEAVHPEFVSQRTRGVSTEPLAWSSDHHELRADRACFFRNQVRPGRQLIRYLVRVRAAGTAVAPGTKIEEMYHPERFGLAETVTVIVQPAD
ncbi:MAG: hypothetical protein FJ387_13090 [Verrucomicrobia bacterium]|nr:hypothetical protein [Verrucomicrobiota bacterium]